MSFVIVVAHKSYEVTDEMIPYFKPELTDSLKIWGEELFETLPSLVDPADMYVYVSKIEIVPPKAR